MKSCKYIQTAIYFAPDELRVCCQRFHVDGVLKGDVSLTDVKALDFVDSATILSLKQKLLTGINAGTDKRCDGCQYLVDQDWSPLGSQKIDLISIEDHSLCNMKCDYCSPTYYGGVPPQYEIDWLELASSISHDCYFAWGGGEPTIRRDFDSLFDHLATKISKHSYHKIFTNCLTFSPSLEKYLSEGRVQIITSVDAGDEETFRKVRGAPGIQKVFRNLKRYNEVNPNGITIKYILTSENSDISNLEKFTKLIIENGLSNCPILISTDFKKELVSIKEINIAVEFYNVLKKAKIGKIIYDDHFVKRSPRDRIIISSESQVQNINPGAGFAICGTGYHSDLLTSRIKSRFPSAHLLYVETNANKINDPKRKIITYEELSESFSDVNILIGSTTFANEILNRLESHNIDFDRIISELVFLK